MEKVSLYRKYRPNDFKNLVGQDITKSTLVNAFKNNHVSHAYLFSGPRGTGKTSTARLVAKSLNCASPEDGYDPCNECEFCMDISAGKLIDIIEIDAASNRGINEVRDLREKINYAPTRSKCKVYIIDEVHMMTNDAFNALLKTLEEPPDHAYFILATTELHKIPETIVSRCQSFDFKRITKEILINRLAYISEQEGIKSEKKALEAIARYVDGGMRDAIGLLEQLQTDNELTLKMVQEMLGLSNTGMLESLFDAIIGNKTGDALKIVQDLHIAGSDLRQFIHDFVEILRQKMLDAINNNKKDDVPRIIEMIEIFQSSGRNLTSSIPQLPLEIAVIKSTKGFHEAPKDPAKNAAPVKSGTEPTKSLPQAQTRVQPPAPDSPRAQTKVQPPDSPPATTKPQTQASPSSTGPEQGQPKSKEAVAENKREHKSLNFDLDSIKNSWPRIPERIKTPSLRMSLKSASPIEVKDNTLTLQFTTNFHKEKVMENDCRVELEAIVKDLFGKDIKIDAIVREVEIKPVVDKPETFVPPPPQNMPNAKNSGGKAKKDDEMLDQALDIFGGKVV
ncbi:DNA polymerase III subunit gamma/tau [Candidatus Peregrinibacteria bacterium]|nr:DNA polymerase III subunit gamma/tau [Candidatus Peregrinibacteria bacterium]